MKTVDIAIIILLVIVVYTVIRSKYDDRHR